MDLAGRDRAVKHGSVIGFLEDHGSAPIDLKTIVFASSGYFGGFSSYVEGHSADGEVW